MTAMSSSLLSYALFRQQRRDVFMTDSHILVFGLLTILFFGLLPILVFGLFIHFIAYFILWFIYSLYCLF